MKKPSQIRGRDNGAGSVAQRKAPTRRVKLRVSREFRAAVENAARKRGLTKSQFAESAIREELARLGAAGKGRGAKPRRPLVRPEATKITTRGVRGLSAADEGRITTRSTAGTVPPGVIQLRDKAGVVFTGKLEWTVQEFYEALRTERFLITVLPDFHRFALAEIERGRLYGEFLTLLTTVHLAELRDSVPLYWIEESDPERWLLISLRGELPAGSDPKYFAKARKALAAEMKTRGIDRALCKTLDTVESVCRHGEPHIVKEMMDFLDRMAAEIKAARQAKGGAN